MITTHGKLIRIGNSMALIIPKVIIDNYSLKKGQSLVMGLYEDGIIIPMTLNENDYEIKILSISRDIFFLSIFGTFSPRGKAVV